MPDRNSTEGWDHWLCTRCGEVDGPVAGLICHANAGICAMEGHEVVHLSHGAALHMRPAAHPSSALAQTGKEVQP